MTATFIEIRIAYTRSAKDQTKQQQTYTNTSLDFQPTGHNHGHDVALMRKMSQQTNVLLGIRVNAIEAHVFLLIHKIDEKYLCCPFELAFKSNRIQLRSCEWKNSLKFDNFKFRLVSSPNWLKRFGSIRLSTPRISITSTSLNKSTFNMSPVRVS